MTKVEDRIFRIWYYFRTGYATYFTFVLGIISFTTTTYYLAVNNMPFLSNIFPNVFTYMLFLVAVLPPLAIIVGWYHMKKSLAFPSQTSVMVESNPYTYKLQPGISAELAWPMWELMLSIMDETLGKSGNLSPEQREAIQNLRSKIHILLEGGALGLPEDLRMAKVKGAERETNTS